MYHNNLELIKTILITLSIQCLDKIKIIISNGHGDCAKKNRAMKIQFQVQFAMKSLIQESLFYAKV